MRSILLVWFFIFLSFFNTVQAQKETREAFKHPTLGDVILVKVYEKYTDAVDYEHFEKTVIISDPIFGEMKVVNEYDSDGCLLYTSPSPRDS